jgi:hypothetical protein
MRAMTFKQRAQQVIDSLPEEPTSQEVESALQEFIDNIKVEEGQRDFREGRTFSNDEVKHRMARWLAK